MRNPSYVVWSSPVDDFSVFVLFLLVSTLYYRRRNGLIVFQTRYLPLVFHTWVILCKPF